jgi:azurin
MLKFANLSLSQKRFVVAVIESNPQYKKDPSITLKECAAIYYTLRDTRTGAKNEKIGYPNWLFNKNKVERGVYQLPVPTAQELSDYQKELDAKLNPVAKAKAKVAKVQKAKTVKVKSAPAKKAEKTQDALEASKLQKIIDDSVEVDADVEDFNEILRENGIQV